MMMWGYGPWSNNFWGSGFWWMGLIGILVQLLFWIGLIAIVYNLVRRISHRSRPYYQRDEAMEILRERYAKGEINDEEFIRLKKDLLS